MRQKDQNVTLRILQLLLEHPEGLDITEIRKLLALSGVQQHLDRRLRDLDPCHIISRTREGRRVVYRYVSPRKDGEWDYKIISKTLRAKVILRAPGRCQSCGKTTVEDQIRLHIDHKIPREWGGPTDEDNLWAICSVCNEGKRNYFANFDSGAMRRIIAHDSVHERIVELLHLRQNEWVDCDLIEFVANAMEQQTDWRKRLRELRYFGLDIKSMRKTVGKRSVSYYCLTNWVDLPEDITKSARDYERNRARKRR